MDVLHPTIRAMLASAPRGRLDLGSIGRWARSLRSATGADAVLLVLPAEFEHGWSILYESGAADFDGTWLAVLRPLGVDLDLPLKLRRLVPGDDLLRRVHPAFSHPAIPAHDSILVPVDAGGGRTGWAVAAGASSRHQRRFEAAVSAVGGDVAAALAQQESREEMLAALLRALPAAAFVVGGDGEVRIATAAATDLLGLRTARSDLGAIQESTGLALTDLVASASRGGTRLSAELEGPFGPLRIEAAGLPEPSSSHDAWGPVLVTITDLSERRRVARQQNEFLSTVGHELRTPMTSLRSALELLERTEDATADERERLTAMAVRNCERLDRLIAKLLDTARQRMGQMLLEREKLLLAPVLVATLEDCAHTARRTSRRLDLRVDPSVRAWVDPVRLVEMVEALFANALEFTPANGSIEFRLRGDVDHPSSVARDLLEAAGLSATGCEVAIEDDGSGMDDVTRSRAFEPFYQDGDPLGDRPTGVGLGLAIVRALTEAHDGQVRLESERGEGTRIRVWLPGEEASAAVLRRLRELEGAAVRALKQGERLALQLVRPGARPTGEPLRTMPLAGGYQASLRVVAEEWRPDSPLSSRIGNDGEPIGTSLARLWAQCVAGAELQP
jgi:signal transduction histidine kinase